LTLAPLLRQVRRRFCTCEGNAAVADAEAKRPLSFQDVILTLHAYSGCARLCDPSAL